MRSIKYLMSSFRCISDLANERSRSPPNISNDLKWNYHIDYIFKKACKRLFSLGILTNAGVASRQILKVYLTTIRSVLEYGVQVC